MTDLGLLRIVHDHARWHYVIRIVIDNRKRAFCMTVLMLWLISSAWVSRDESPSFSKESAKNDVFASITALCTTNAKQWRDLILNEFTSRNKTVHFIQVGACDGNWKHSNDRLQQSVMTSPHFHGMMIEPVPELFERLRATIQNDEDTNHRIQIIHAAISPDHDGSATFYTVNVEEIEADWPAAPHWLKYQLGSFDKGHIQKHLMIDDVAQNLKKDWNHYISQIMVNAITPSTLMDQYWKSTTDVGGEQRVHILMIDAEGYDGKIFEAFMALPRMRPNIVVFEKKHMASQEVQECLGILQTAGYHVYVPTNDAPDIDIVAVKAQIHLIL